MTVGGNLVKHPGKVATKTADLTTTKLLISQMIANLKQQSAAVDIIKHFYPNNNLPITEYIRIPTNIIPDDIFQQYELHKFKIDGCVYAAVTRESTDSLKQAALQAMSSFHDSKRQDTNPPVEHLDFSNMIPIQSTSR